MKKHFLSIIFILIIAMNSFSNENNFKYKNNETSNFKRVSFLDPEETLYDKYMKFKHIGIGLVIPGSIITSITLAVLTPFMILTPHYEYGLESGNIADMGHAILVSYYIIFLVIGVGLDIGAILCFIKSALLLKEWKKSNNVSLLLRYQNDSAAIGLKYKF